MNTVFIDGSSGTTALQIKTLLKPWQDSNRITLLEIENTRDLETRLEAHKQADISVLCLPDEAAREIIPFLKDMQARVIDASSAYRTDPDWVYGFPELSADQPNLIRQGQFVTNPGCFATGAISILNPLVRKELIDPRQTHTIFGVSGYTGGGKSLINKYETPDNVFRIANVFGAYSTDKMHKHVPEIKKHSGLISTPIFMPNVINQPRGMIVSIPFNRASLVGNMYDVHRTFEDFYSFKDSMVRVMPINDTQSRINFLPFVDLNTGSPHPIPHVELHITGWEQRDDSQVTIHALLDNLGKGAGAQVVQNMKLMLD